MNKQNKLTTFSLTLLITGAIDSFRNLPTAALFGSALLFYFFISAIIFLIPTALVSAELTANVGAGGIYQWVRLAFGERTGFFAIWLQWINNIFWFPTVLSFIAGTAAYLVDPALAQNKYYLFTFVVAVFWLLTIVSLRGIHLSAKFSNICSILGLLTPMLIIILLLISWFILDKPVQIHLTMNSMLPDLFNGQNWIAFTGIMVGFAGVELSTVHIKDVHDPKKTFPRALLFSTIIIMTAMILGSLAIAYVIPKSEINLVNGAMQTFSCFLTAYHLGWVTPVLAILMVIGSIGGITSWIISPIKGVSEAASNGFLPNFFQKQNLHGAPQVLMIFQAILVTIVCSAFLFLPSVNGSYWMLTSLAMQLYMLMYTFMFISAIALRGKFRTQNGVFNIPGNKFGTFVTCILGLIGCFITLYVGFIPPEGMNIGSSLKYEIIYCLSMVIMILPTIFCYWYQWRSKNRFRNVNMIGDAVNA